MPLRAKLYGGRTYGRIALVYACDADLFVLVSYGHYDYAQVNNFQGTQIDPIRCARVHSGLARLYSCIIISSAQIAQRRAATDGHFFGWQGQPLALQCGF